MVNTLVLELEGKVIELSDKTESTECLVFANSDWKIEITLRDEISFWLLIEYRKNLVPNATLRYYCSCSIYKRDVELRKVFNRLGGNEIHPSYFLLPLENWVKNIFRQLRVELLHPFKDPDYAAYMLDRLQKMLKEAN